MFIRIMNTVNLIPLRIVFLFWNIISQVSWRVLNVLLQVIKAVTWLFKKSEKLKTDSFNETLFKEKPVGLNNFSAECYINSIIQALAACDTFIKELDKMKVLLQTSDTNLDSLIDLLNSVNDPNSKSYANSQKLESLIKNVGWNKSSQQDTYELLSVIINCIDKEIKNHPNSNQFTMPLKVKVRHSFQGVNIVNRIQNYLGLSLGLSGNYSNYPGVSLESLINEYFEPIIIDDDPAKSSQIIFFKVIPEILLLHIQANKWDLQKGEMIKPQYYIKYNPKFCMKLAVADDQNNEPKMCNVEYKLCAIVHHMGNISGGHYIAYRKWRNHWYLVNDEQVNKCDFKCDVCPYILIYEKM